MPQRVSYLGTLPLRVAPLPGEAIDSWLEAIAARHTTTFGAVLAQCGIHAGGNDGARLMAPSRPTINGIAYVTGIAPAVVQAMTLTPDDGAVNTGRRRHVWGWRTCSRACPHCLAETHGRWPLSWRHNLTFACMKHQCLLIDTCPRCQQSMRSRPHRTQQVPVPGHCANTYRRPPPPSTGPLCGADLATSPEAPLCPQHPVLRAQDRIDTLRAGYPITLAVYGRQPCNTEALIDITVLARWMVSAVDQIHLEHVLDTQRNIVRRHGLRSHRAGEREPAPRLDHAQRFCYCRKYRAGIGRTRRWPRGGVTESVAAQHDRRSTSATDPLFRVHDAHLAHRAGACRLRGRLRPDLQRSPRRLPPRGISVQTCRFTGRSRHRVDPLTVGDCVPHTAAMGAHRTQRRGSRRRKTPCRCGAMDLAEMTSL